MNLFDTIGNITNDPQFQTGLGLIGAASPVRNAPAMAAFQALQLLNKNRQQEALNKSLIESRNSQAQMENERTKLYGQQVQGQLQGQAALQRQQEMIAKFLPAIQKYMGVDTGAQPEAAPTPQPNVPQPQVGPQGLGSTPVMPQTQVQAQPLPPMSDTFNRADKFVAGIEGGYVPNDAGKGPTNFGINQFANPDINVRNLTPETAAEVRKQRYWNAIGGDSLPPNTAMVAYDAAINQGQQYAKNLLQKTGGDPTLMLYQRMQDYRDLAKQPIYADKLKGWEARLNDLRKQISDTSAAAAGAAAGPAETPPTPGTNLASGGMSPSKMLQLAGGAVEAMGLSSGPAGLVHMGKALEDEKLQPGTIIRDFKGNITQVPNPITPYQQAELAGQAQTRAQGERRLTFEEQQARQQMDIREQGQKQKLAKDTGLVGDTLAKTDNSISKINELLSSPGLDHITGRYAGMPAAFRRLIDPEGMNAQAALDSIKSQVLLGQLMAMKELSSNGSSGFGQLNENEGQAIRSSLASLSESQTTEAIKKNLTDIRNVLQGVRERTSRVYKDTWGSKAMDVEPKKPADNAPISLDEYLKKVGK